MPHSEALPKSNDINLPGLQSLKHLSSGVGADFP